MNVQRFADLAGNLGLLVWIVRFAYTVEGEEQPGIFGAGNVQVGQVEDTGTGWFSCRPIGSGYPFRRRGAGPGWPLKSFLAAVETMIISFDAIASRRNLLQQKSPGQPSPTQRVKITTGPALSFELARRVFPNGTPE